jgi:hypothetical protein
MRYRGQKQTLKMEEETSPTQALVHTITCKWGLIDFNILMERVVNLMPWPLLTWERAPSTE